MTEAVQAAFPEGDAFLEYRKGSRKVAGYLVWQGFDSLDHLDRQKKMWEILRNRLGPDDAARISFIFTYTPREYHAMMEH